MTNPMYEGSDGATFTAGMGAKILQFFPQHLVCDTDMQDIYDVGQVIVDPGEPINPGNWYRLWERPKKKRKLRKPKYSFNQL